MPESFRVLMKEFQALGLDISVIDDEGNELDLKVIEQEEYKEVDFNQNENEIDAPLISTDSEGDSSYEEESEFNDDDDDFV